MAAQRAQATAVAAAADLLAQPFTAAGAFVPPLLQVGQVRIEEAGPHCLGTGTQVTGAGCGDVAAHCLAVQVQDAADLGDGQAAAQRGLDLAVAVPGLLSALPPGQTRWPIGLGGTWA